MKKIFVFLSRPNPFLDEHEVFLTKLKSLLSKHSIEAITLQAANYDLSDSINYLKGMIQRSYGIIIVGFKQIFIEKGCKKPGGKQEERFYYSEEIPLDHQFLTSPFCQIEGTIGLLYDLPLLIINEEGLIENGILTGGRFSFKTDNFSLSNIDDFFANDVIKMQINAWIGKVNEKYLFLNLKKV